MGRARRLCLATTAALCAAAPADAGVVTSQLETVAFRAAAGEANALAMSVSSAGDSTTVLVTDTGAALTATGDCRSLDAHSASCRLPGVSVNFSAELGDESDSAVLEGVVPVVVAGSWVDGGAGADAISLARLVSLEGTRIDVRGQSGNDTLIGGAAHEDFEPGEGDDAVKAGRRADRIFEGPGSDRTDGGPGSDVIDFRASPRAVVADLATGTASGWGADRLSRIELVFGSRFADVLRGDANGNHLSGERGADRIVGRAGDDFLIGGSGDDRLTGGLGGDFVFAESGRDVVLGGPGHDELFGGAGPDRLFARDHRRDRLNGGAGFDCAVLDRDLDRPLAIEASSCGRNRTLTG